MAKNVLAFSEDRGLLIQLLGKGKALADSMGGELNVLLVGSNLSDSRELAQYGSKKTLVIDGPEFEHFSVETYKAALMKAVEASDPRIILIGATKRGKELAARVAAALDTGCMTECLSLELDEKGNLVSERLTYAGSTISTEVSRKAPHIATIPSRAFETPEPGEGVGETVTLDVSISEPKVKIVERREKTKGDLGLESASIIVSAGRGFKAKEDLKILEELAEVLGAKVGCSRPISADMGWMEEWIGISGRKVSPKLYLACGISGTIQHAAGIRDSQIIVAINKDENANIHEISDYSIVGDLYTVLPALIKSLKEKIG
ncbi:MAG: electron transfer flavoprotein subunit alpha/FixB family protein [Candidatus Bathyarchaeia archaeon]